MNKKIFIIILVFALILSAIGCKREEVTGIEPIDKPDIDQESLDVHKEQDLESQETELMEDTSKLDEIEKDMPAVITIKDEEFKKGTFKNVSLTDDYKLIIKDSSLKGMFESDPIDTLRFTELIASWNGKTSENSTIEIQIKIRSGDEWSKWFSYGKWSDNGFNKGSKRAQDDEIGEIDIDVIETKTDVIADGFKYRVMLERTEETIDSPSVRLVVASLDPYNKRESDDSYETCEVDIQVPTRSQMIVPEIGNVICSPTSLSMVLEFHGVDEDTAIVAFGCQDKRVDIYGNWAYNVAYAGERGFESYVRKCESINDIKEYLLEGIPVVASIKTNSVGELQGSPMAYSSGHLLVIRGLTNKDGADYIIVNDPAAKSNETVRREYKLGQFLNVWAKVIYVVEPINKERNI